MIKLFEYKLKIFKGNYSKMFLENVQERHTSQNQNGT